MAEHRENSANNSYNFNILFYESPQPMWIIDSVTLRFLEVNDAAVRIYGFQKEEFLSMTIRDILVGGDHKDLNTMDLPGNETYNIESHHQYKNGALKHVEVTVFPFIFNGIRSRLSYVRDITAKKKRESLLRYLNLVGEELALALDTDSALKKIAELIVPRFADWFTINILNGDNVELLFVENTDPEYVSWAKTYRQRNPITINDKSLTGHILRTGESSLVPVVTQEMLEKSIEDLEQREVIKKLNLRSSIIVPMKVHNRIIGTINFISTREGKEFDEIDLNFAKDVAIRIALALENARLHEETQEALKKAEKAEAESQAINEEITAINEELVASNDQLVTAHNHIHESEERFRTMAEDTDVLIAVADESSNGVYFNKAWQNLTGKSMTELLKFGWADLIHPDDKDAWINKYLSAFREQKSLSGEFRLLSKEGDYRWLLARIPARFRSDGSFAGYISSCLDITELKKDAIRKNDFIGMVSHELKTPLTTLSALIQVTNSKLKNSEDKFLKDAMDKAQIQVKRMGNMINGFLNISRLESGKMIINKSEFNLESLIYEIADEIKLTVSDYNIHVIPCNPASIKVNGDRDKIGSVISNLLSNATKYSQPGKAIELRCEIVENAAIVSIKDEGIGVKDQDKERLFERYYRVDNPNSQHISGFGIGLYLSAEIIERHEGKIWVESEVGKGSTFYFSLPLS